jgi:hypothetical protein
MTQTLRLGFTDTIKPVEEFFTEVLSIDYTVIRDDKDPDYLIFGDRNFGENNKSFNGKNTIKIFYTGENQRAWDYDAHYGISFDHIDNDRHYRLPLYVIYDWDNNRKGVNNSRTFTRSTSDLVDLNKRDFCSFIVKNPSCQKRNDFFHKLSAYKQVTSAGPHLNNAGFILEGGANAVQAKLAYLPKFKFTLCFENASYPGYATEKLYEALMGYTIPIYWGSPTIECDFNPRAFLNWNDYLDDEAFIQAIIDHDNSPEAYKQMYMEMPFAYGNMNKYFSRPRFLNWFGK